METVSGKFFSGFELINTDVLVNFAYFLERDAQVYTLNLNFALRARVTHHLLLINQEKPSYFLSRVWLFAVELKKGAFGKKFIFLPEALCVYKSIVKLLVVM
ncbi:MAG: hypothetical protein LBL57_00160 [Tannerella sp.]|jgi:hypothetical protein|nr:hypothetical protein [Tannerella sp.]